MTTPTTDRVFQLVKADMERAEDQMRLILYTAMFHSERPMFAMFTPRPSWIRRQYWRVRGYVSTLWLALKGADLREDDDA